MFYELKAKINDNEVFRVVASEAVILKLIEMLPRYYVEDVVISIEPTRVSL